MHRRELLVATGTVAATALSGCAGALGNTGDPAAQNDTPSVDQQNGRSIIVSNTGEVTAEPDLAVLAAGVEASADSASTVRADLADRSDALREALLDFGLDEDEVTTDQFNIRERIDRRQMEEDGVRPDSPDATEEYTYYAGTHSFRVEIETIDDVGAVIDAAVEGGADQIDRVTFTLSDERRDARREDALRQAIQGAREEAETVADEVGASIVEATVVDASQGQVSPVHRDVSYAAVETSAPETNVEPGDVTVTASVRVEYRME